jgi:MarR family transcriptional regulator, transcriptional regulator for hemolysin
MQTKIPSHSEPGAASATALAQLRARFGQLIGSVYRQWRRQVDLELRDSGLSDASRMPLITLYTHPMPMLQKELAQALHLDTSSLVRVLAQLRAAGLVQWHCQPTDRRTKCIALTDAGRDTAARILQYSLHIEHAILDGISAEDLEVTRRTLETISRRFNTL